MKDAQNLAGDRTAPGTRRLDSDILRTSRATRSLSTGAAALALALTLAACGGGDDESDGSGTGEGSSAVSSPEDGADTPSDGASTDGTSETSTDGADGGAEASSDGGEAPSSGDDPVAGDQVTDLPESVVIQMLHIVSAGDSPVIDVITVQAGSMTVMSGDPTAEGPDSQDTVELTEDQWAALRSDIADLGLTTPEGQAEDLMTSPDELDEIEGQYDWEILAVEGTQPRSLGWDSGDPAQDQALWDLLSSYAE
ncbi:Ferric enterobactin-binding periplasmic protein FepB (TC 3.A.1.14.2) [Actinomycetales bacterium JB111]|nr:Ferric enterobactin-binding periplasmic protein FepB (TC 3.A.1.14.2) [Actinomycetales bacterium JB111]